MFLNKIISRHIIHALLALSSRSLSFSLRRPTRQSNHKTWKPKSAAHFSFGCCLEWTVNGSLQFTIIYKVEKYRENQNISEPKAIRLVCASWWIKEFKSADSATRKLEHQNVNIITRQ